MERVLKYPILLKIPNDSSRLIVVILTFTDTCLYLYFFRLLGNTKKNVKRSYTDANDKTNISFNWVYTFVILG